MLSSASGNVVYFIPVGALTSKSYNFTYRSWELKIRKSIDYFSFFAYPVTVALRGPYVFKISSFKTKNWISDTTRFFFQGLIGFANNMNTLTFSNKSYTISWYETSFFIVKEFIGNKFFLRRPKCFYKLKVPVVNFCVVGQYIDVKDINIIWSKFFFVANSIILFPYLNGFFFQAFTSVTRQTYVSAALIENNFAKVTFISSYFIFWSNLRYEAPVLNFRIRRLVVENIDFRVFFFGEFNTSYLFNYPVVYIGSLSSFFKLISGRLKNVSSIFFRISTASIFGSFFYNFHKEFSAIIIKFVASLQNSIDLQPDFSQNSIFLYSNNFGLASKNFDIFFSSSRSLYNKFNAITLNTKRNVVLTNKTILLASNDMFSFFGFKLFKFDQKFFPSNDKFFFSWFCDVNINSFVTYQNYYLNVFNRVQYLPYLFGNSNGNSGRSIFQAFTYVFSFTLEKYNRYMSNYMTFGSRFFIRSALNFMSVSYGSPEILSYFINQKKLDQFAYKYSFDSVFSNFLSVDRKLLDDAELFVWFHVFVDFYSFTTTFLIWFINIRSYIHRKRLFFSGSYYSIRKIRNKNIRPFNIFQFNYISRYFVWLHFKKNCIFLSTYTSLFKFFYNPTFRVYSFNNSCVFMNCLKGNHISFSSFWLSKLCFINS